MIDDRTAGAFYILGGSNGFIYEWINVGEKSGRKCHAAVKAHKGPVMALSQIHDGTKIASASKEGKIKIWEAHNLELISEVNTLALFDTKTGIFSSIQMVFGKDKEKALSKHDLRALSLAKASKETLVVKSMQTNSAPIEDGFEMYFGTSGTVGQALVKATVCGLKEGTVSRIC